MPRLLTIDDDRSVHHLVSKSLSHTSIEVLSALTAEQGIESVENHSPDAVLLDVMLPDMSGLDAYKLIRAIDSRLPIIIVTAAGSSETAIEAMKLGAFDFLTKPIDVDNLERLVGHAIESHRLAKVPVGIDNVGSFDASEDAFVGRSPQMQEVFKSIGRVAPQDVPVLVRGESGTGKELVARAIYQHSLRSDGPFLAVNCAALSETLLESELFGHEKGAFTNAHDRRIGKFEQCDGGTIFLDEVGDMSPLVQSKVLRLLQQQSFERVGGNKTITTNVRIVSATNRDLETMCESNEFRNDLFYRLNGYTIMLPPLRERGDDRVTLLKHFLAGCNEELDRDVQTIAPEAMKWLLAYRWPGNVREMQSVIKQAMLHCTGPVLMPSALPSEIKTSLNENNAAKLTPEDTSDTPVESVKEVVSEDEGLNASSLSPTSDNNLTNDELKQKIEELLLINSGDLYAETLAYMEKELLSHVLTHTNGNQSEASRILGITRGSLRNKIRSNGIVIGPSVTVEEANNEE